MIRKTFNRAYPVTGTKRRNAILIETPEGPIRVSIVQGRTKDTPKLLVSADHEVRVVAEETTKRYYR